jgi:proline racemase
MRFSSMITAVDAHAGGEPGRVITGGVVDVPGDTMFAKMQYLQGHRDGLRKLMLREPRGYPGLCCNILLPPTHPEADAGFVIMEQVEYPPMSGSNTICTATVLLETGILPMHEPVTEFTLEAPAGLVKIRAGCRDGKVTGVTFENVPAFAVHLDAQIDVPSLGTLTVDVAYGGMWYVLCEAEQVDLSITPGQGAEIVRIGEMIKAAAREQLPVAHPDNPDISGVSILVFSGPASRHDLHRPADRRNAGWPLCRGRACYYGAGLDHRHCPVPARPYRPVSGGVHGRRLVGRDDLTPALSCEGEGVRRSLLYRAGEGLGVRS